MTGLGQHAAQLLGVPLASALPLSGGSLSQIVRLTLADGRQAIAKTGPSPRAEAAMLSAIRRAGVSAPAVLAVDDTTLVIEMLADDGGLAGAWPDLGRQLATLHRAVGDRYGWNADYAFGAVAIANGASLDWPSFWAERRLLVHLPHIAPALGRRLERLAAALPSLLPKRPRPALLHGDLWGGNILTADGRVSGLIDPACYYGHTEVDLAMLAMFDHPLPHFAEAYGPPEPGFEARRPIYGLWPALVHLRLFGGGYRARVEQGLSAAGF